MEKLIIIGSGPAAHTAAIYAGRAKLEPLMFEGFLAAGVAAGGQLTTTTEIENFPGFPEAISGPKLMERMREQAIKCGTRIKSLTVDGIDIKTKPFKVFVGKETYEAQTLIIATGATAKRLNVPGEEKLWQKGVSACAVCDGALPIFRNKVLAVIGGGDTAAEESTYLTKFASKVLLIVRRDELRASKAMQERIKANPKIEIIWNTVLEEILGENVITGIKVKNVRTSETHTLEAGGLFYAIGHLPNSGFLGGQLPMDENGYLKTFTGTARTSIEGIFACGDVQDKVYRQAVTAAGSGCMAALDAERFLSEQSHH